MAFDFLGFGLVRPFHRDAADFAAAGGEALVRGAVGQILGTIGASDRGPGELAWRTEFGSALALLRNQRNDAVLQALARVYVVDALQRWEPRIVVREVKVTREQQVGQDVLSIRITYDFIATNVPGNQVILANVEQTVRVGT